VDGSKLKQVIDWSKSKVVVKYSGQLTDDISTQQIGVFLASMALDARASLLMDLQLISRSYETKEAEQGSFDQCSSLIYYICYRDVWTRCSVWRLV
jgi:hypothetical protein